MNVKIYFEELNIIPFVYYYSVNLRISYKLNMAVKGCAHRVIKSLRQTFKNNDAPFEEDIWFRNSNQIGSPI